MDDKEIAKDLTVAWVGRINFANMTHDQIAVKIADIYKLIYSSIKGKTND